jgi:hypothetical protein
MAELPKFQAGRPLEDELTSGRMNQIVSAINANELQQGTGIRITRGDGGTTISAVPQRTALDIRPFTAYISQDAESNYKGRVSKGFLIETKLDALESFVYHEPDGIELDGVPVLHDLTLGQGLFLEASVGIDGKITGTPSIVVGDDSTESIHYFPIVGDYAGAVGTVRYKLFILETATGRAKKYFSGQNVLHYAERVTMKNLGDATTSATEYNVLKDYDPTSDEVNFRNIEQRDGTGETIIATDGADSIPIKRVAQRATSPQVTVSTVDDDIVVEGNGVDGDNGAVTVVDGLVTVVKALLAGKWATITWTFLDETGGSDSNELVATIEDGSLVNLTATSGFISGAGTEADPWIAQFTAKDTDT